MKNKTFSPIDHKVLPDRIVNYIRDKIITGKLKPNEKVSEAKLSDELHISRTPIREAIRLLECEGFVEIIPRKGAIVKSFSKENILNTFEVKAVIEALGVSKSAEKLSEKDINKIELSIDAEQKYFEKGDIGKFFKEFDKFNSTLLKNCTNEYLLDINLKMSNHIMRYRYFCFKFPEILKDVPNSQKAIIKLIKEKNFTTLRSVYEEYIKNIGIKITDKISSL